MIRKLARSLARRGWLGVDARQRVTAEPQRESSLPSHPKTTVSSPPAPDTIAQLEAAEERLKREIPPRED